MGYFLRHAHNHEEKEGRIFKEQPLKKKKTDQARKNENRRKKFEKRFQLPRRNENLSKSLTKIKIPAHS